MSFNTGSVYLFVTVAKLEPVRSVSLTCRTSMPALLKHPYCLRTVMTRVATSAAMQPPSRAPWLRAGHHPVCSQWLRQTHHSLQVSPRREIYKK